MYPAGDDRKNRFCLQNAKRDQIFSKILGDWNTSIAVKEAYKELINYLEVELADEISYASGLV